MISAAGILFLTKDGQALFLKRGPGANHAGEWCFPGGTQEGDETALECAVREATEEAGKIPDGNRILWTRRIDQIAPPIDTGVDAPALISPESVDFITFLQRVDKPFDVTIDDDHTGYAWARITEPPEPLHPGCRVALDRFTMNELDIAKAMASGNLTSPQSYANLVLFDIRITGTGASYRSGTVGKDGKREGEEYVIRPPEEYLNEEFLQRCSGLPVLWVHPKKALLNSKEFANRVIGTVLWPYIKGDEVWGIAKVFDTDAIAEMNENQLSTSPGVMTGGRKLKMEDGTSLLVEGKPSLVDHIAIVPLGVWDKGGPPAGVVSEATVIGDEEMSVENKADAAKADAVKADENIDKVLKAIGDMATKVDAVCARMDAFETRETKKDADEKEKADADEKAEKEKADADESDDKPKEVVADKKADADDKKDEPKKDSAKRDADEKKEEAKADAALGEIAGLKAQIAALTSAMPKQLSDQDYASMTEAQAKADGVFQAHGERASRPLDGENVLAYRKRLAKRLQSHSEQWKDADLAVLSPDVFQIAEAAVYADAMTAALNPVGIPAGELREHIARDKTGRQISTFHGPSTFITGLKPPARRVSRFNFNQHAA